MNIDRILSGLPEKYQPIYGYQNLSQGASRDCEERKLKLIQIYSEVERLLARPLRVLDLGCAQGFFSLTLAQMGATVTGVDFLPANIQLCNALKSQAQFDNIKFHCAKLEDFIVNIRSGEYDLVLGFSVFHHIVYEHGIDFTSGLISHLADKIKIGLYELAVSEEPVYWSSELPRDPRAILGCYAFVSSIQEFSTHLTNINRPLFFASNFYWKLGSKCGVINAFMGESHALEEKSHNKSRRYFASGEYFIKVYDIKCEHRGVFNKNEFNNEIKFLNNIPNKFNAARLIESGQSNYECWVITTKLDGCTLLNCLQGSSDIRIEPTILMKILDQLVILEESGQFHNDLRAWNIMVSENEKLYLIDYGSITPIARDCSWPNNIFVSFILLANEIGRGSIFRSGLLRGCLLSPFHSFGLYQEWIKMFWERPPQEWSFRSLRDGLNNLLSSHSSENHSAMNVEEIWRLGVEQYLNLSTQKIIELESLVRGLEVQIRAITSSNIDRATLDSVYKSNSWKITAPLRVAATYIKVKFNKYRQQ